MWINRGVFSTNNNIRFRLQVSSIKVDNEIELEKKFQSSCLVIEENFGS